MFQHPNRILPDVYVERNLMSTEKSEVEATEKFEGANNDVTDDWTTVTKCKQTKQGNRRLPMTVINNGHSKFG